MNYSTKIFFISTLLLPFALLSCKEKNKASIKNENIREDTILDEALVEENVMEENWTFKEVNFSSADSDFSLTCRVSESGALQLPLEDFCSIVNASYEVCGRCGNTALFLPEGDVLLVQWQSPYVDYRNREGRITLSCLNVFYENKTYAELSLFEKFFGIVLKK